MFHGMFHDREKTRPRTAAQQMSRGMSSPDSPLSGRVDDMAKAADEHPDGIEGIARTIEISAANGAEHLVRGVRHLAERAELHLAARRTSLDPSAKTFVEQVKTDVASGAIHEQVASQTDLRTLLKEHGY